MTQVVWESKELVTQSCDLCGSSDFFEVYTRPDGLKAVECPACGLCFLNPMPNRDSIRKLYKKGYHDLTADRNRTSSTGTENHLDDEHVQNLLKPKRKRAQMVAGHVDLMHKRCLEIGCATGEFSYVLSEMGALPVGIDLGEDAVEIARRRYPGLAVHCCDIEGLPMDQAFDVILAFEVIEHVLSPDRFFAEVRKRLALNGLFVLSTPNYGCAKRLGHGHWVGLNEILEHIFFLEFRTLAKYGEKHGMDVEASYSKGGAGKVRKGAQRMARDLLHRMNLGRVVQRARGAVTGEENFMPNTDQHDLYMVFRKRA